MHAVFSQVFDRIAAIVCDDVSWRLCVATALAHGYRWHLYCDVFVFWRICPLCHLQHEYSYVVPSATSKLAKPKRYIGVFAGGRHQTDYGICVGQRLLGQVVLTCMMVSVSASACLAT